MISANFQNFRVRNQAYRAFLALAIALLASFVLVHAGAQTRNPKRITSVWTATSAEGSRVHVDSDAAISDYEAYTRGDRFYVKIPSADLPSARGSLLGRGFDDVQIQRFGDGIIISFRLQPGSTARVEQASNHLEIVFASVRFQSVASRSNASEVASRTRVRRIADAAGPSPASSPERKALHRPGIEETRNKTTGRRTGKQSAKTTTEVAANTATGSTGKTSTNAASSKLQPSPGASSASAPQSVAPSPTPSPASPSPSPSTSPTATPAASPLAQLAVSPTVVNTPTPVSTPVASISVPVAAGDNDWASRRHYWKVWAELNWVPLLIGSVIALVILLLLVSLFRAKRRRRRESESVKRHARNDAPAVTVATKPITPPLANAASADKAATVSAPQGQTAAQTNSPLVSSSEQQKDAVEDQEREVFEL